MCRPARGQNGVIFSVAYTIRKRKRKSGLTVAHAEIAINPLI
jgi:hypothetical protein